MTDLTAKWTSRLNAFDELTQKWKGVGLGSLQKTTLDADALLLTANKEALAQGRKNLGARTKDFSQLSSELKLVNFGSLLKAYQGYVDELTKYLTEAERCYFNLNGVVQGMVDPFPLMDRFSKEKNTLLEFVKGYEESEGLRRAIKEREAELLELSNQEVTIKKLRAQLAEAELSAMANAEKTVSNSQEELNAVLAQWKMRESELHQELQRALSDQRKSEAEIKELGNLLASLRTKYTELEELRDSETTTLAAELEEAAIQSRLAQREIDRLRMSETELKKVVAVSSAAPGSINVSSLIDAEDVHYAVSLNEELQQTREECSNLRVRCSLLEKEIEKQGSKVVASAGQQSLVTVSIAQLQSGLEAAREEVTRLSDNNDDKERVIGNLRSRLETAESDLIAKVAELTVMRSRLIKSEEEKQPLLSAVRDLERELSGRKQNSSTPGTVETAFDLGSVLNPSQSLPTNSSPPNVASVPPSQVSDEAFFAVTTQRDRLRQRLLALEEAASQEVDQLRSALKSIREERDELLLQQSRGSGGGEAISGGYALKMPVPNPQSLYSPHMKKRQQVVTALDMLTVLLYKHVLADVWMRRVFLGYLTLLHIFVLVDLFYQTSGFF